VMSEGSLLPYVSYSLAPFNSYFAAHQIEEEFRFRMGTLLGACLSPMKFLVI